MSAGEGDKPRIIIDEDWKARAQAEKEQLERAKPSSKSPSDPQPAAPGSLGQAPQTAPDDPLTDDPDATVLEQPGQPAPPASLSLLVGMLAQNAMMTMSLAKGKDRQDSLEATRQLIDLLQVIQDKTVNNRTPDETQLLSAALHELRMTFVYVQQQPA